MIVVYHEDQLVIDSGKGAVSAKAAFDKIVIVYKSKSRAR